MGLPQYPCATEREALVKARELAQKHGRNLEVEILKNDAVLIDKANMRKRIVECTKAARNSR